MTLQHPFLRLALFAALVAAPFALGAQPVDPAAATEAENQTAEAEEAGPTGSDLPTVADEGEVDRRCLKYTGSRTTADATPQTRDRRSAHERRRCAMATGAVYTREDIEGTGHTDLADALRTLDPRIH